MQKKCKCGSDIDQSQVRCTPCVYSFAPSFGFSAGDKVEAFGNSGTVKSTSVNGMFLEVIFPDSPTTVVFTIDGKIHNWNISPSLRKVHV